ncbi:hypothetical protein CGMCC3_g14715 [Colletotrichum fructicola]|nr:uncharacterized protein CGMCC3_g14715 [Colletotrichum fructicola]KAE9569204.1 hypothetical protein CGMCC3_g14715 [Colletotrichum fructicola]
MKPAAIFQLIAIGSSVAFVSCAPLGNEVARCPECYWKGVPETGDSAPVTV